MMQQALRPCHERQILLMATGGRLPCPLDFYCATPDLASDYTMLLPSACPIQHHFRVWERHQCSLSHTALAHLSTRRSVARGHDFERGRGKLLLAPPDIDDAEDCQRDCEQQASH